MPSSNLTRRQFLAGSLTATALLTLKQSRNSQAGGNFVESLWSGALTATSAKVNAKIDHDSPTVRLRVSPNPDLSAPLFSGFAVAETAVNNRMVSLPITNLQSDTQYYYAIEADGILDNTIGLLRTPNTGPYSFRFVISACANTGSNHPVFAAIRQHNPLFYINMGDLHYQDINANNPTAYRNAFDSVLTAPNQALLYQQTPIAYMWDDHDYGPNDSDATAPGRQAARLTYQEYVPHYPLVAGSGDVPIYQAFTIGRVRFILTDTRSERDPASIPFNDPQKTLLGSVQKAWFKQEILAAKNNYPLVIWLSPAPWIADFPGSGTDNWNGFHAERRELADFFQDNFINNLLMISGDVHMLGIDNGTNNVYDSQHKPGFPIFQAAALDRGNGTFFTSNTYSEGQHPGSGQYGLITIMDDGDEVVLVLMDGLNHLNQTVTQLALTMPQSPRFLVTPEVVNFIIYTSDPAPTPQTLTLINCGSDILSWQITVNPPAPWLTVTPENGSTTAVSPTPVTLTADPSQLSLGIYQTTLTVHGTAPHNSNKTIPISLLYTDQLPIHLPLIKKDA